MHRKILSCYRKGGRESGHTSPLPTYFIGLTAPHDTMPWDRSTDTDY